MLAANAAAVDTNQVIFLIEIVPAEGIRLPFSGSGGFGTSPLWGSSRSGNLRNRAPTYHPRAVTPSEIASSHATIGWRQPNGVLGLLLQRGRQLVAHRFRYRSAASYLLL